MVNDDIVTRLRNKRTEFDNWLNDIEGKHSFGHDESIWLDAADEIERLRADSDRWQATAFCRTCEPADGYYCTKHRQDEEGKQ